MKRGRNQRRRPNNNPNRALDSNGPEVRIRGTANQIYDKYIALARDASSSGDRIKAESYLQHAEHYFRLIRSTQPVQTQSQDAGTGEQPSIENGKDRAEERNAGNHSNDRNNNRRRNRSRDDNADPSNQEDSSAAKVDDETLASRNSDDAEAKPKRRRVKRTPAKRSAKESDDSAEDEVAAAAD